MEGECREHIKEVGGREREREVFCHSIHIEKAKYTNTKLKIQENRIRERGVNKMRDREGDERDRKIER